MRCDVANRRGISRIQTDIHSICSCSERCVYVYRCVVDIWICVWRTTAQTSTQLTIPFVCPIRLKSIERQLLLFDSINDRWTEDWIQKWIIESLSVSVASCCQQNGIRKWFRQHDTTLKTTEIEWKQFNSINLCECERCTSTIYKFNIHERRTS